MARPTPILFAGRGRWPPGSSPRPSSSPPSSASSGSPAGFLSSYAADLTCPAWLYVGIRGLHGPKRNRLGRFFGATPERAAGFLFGGSALTEVSQLWWPHGLFNGTLDALDVVAYGTGVGLCYFLDKMMGPGEPGPPATR